MEDRIIKFQVRTMHLYMREKNLTSKQFKAIEDSVGIFDYIKSAYEWLHLTGDRGIIEDLDSLIIKKTPKDSVAVTKLNAFD